MTSTDLRPRNVGELVDLAVTLCVRNALPLLAIAAVAAVPGDLLQQLPQSPLVITAEVVVGFLSLTFSELMGFAYLLAALEGNPPRLRAAFAAARSRFGSGVLVWLAYGAMCAAVATPFAIAVLLIFFAMRGQHGGVRMVVAASPALPVALRDAAIPLIMILGVLGAAASAAIAVLATCALISIAALVEAGRSVRDAIALGGRRLAAGRTRLSAFGFAMSLLAIQVFASFGESAAAPLSGAVRIPVLSLLVNVVVDAAVIVFTLAFVAAFVRDARIRGEGYDLQRALEAS